jgi:hypothetical protein
VTRFSSAINAYTDVRSVFDAAIANGSVNYTFDTRAKAVSWRSRAYAFRRLLLKQSADMLAGTNVAPSTPYDMIYMTLLDDSTTVTIHRERPLGQLTGPDGKPIKLNMTAPVIYDPLQEEADRIAREADIEL